MRSALLRVFRILLAAVLAISLSAAGLVPPLMALGPAAARVDSDEPAAAPATSCCCGTPDGRCCGTTCCERPVRTPQPVPAPTKPDHDRVGPLGFNLASADAHLARAAGTFGRLHPVTAASPREGSSLQAQHVRLDV